jgi:hypothetical protein
VPSATQSRTALESSAWGWGSQWGLASRMGMQARLNLAGICISRLCEGYSTRQYKPDSTKVLVMLADCSESFIFSQAAFTGWMRSRVQPRAGFGRERGWLHTTVGLGSLAIYQNSIAEIAGVPTTSRAPSGLQTTRKTTIPASLTRAIHVMLLYMALIYMVTYKLYGLYQSRVWGEPCPHTRQISRNQWKP